MSNPRRSALQADALPTELPVLIFARGVGIEPTRRGFGDLPDTLSVPRKLPDLARDRHRIRTPREIRTPT